LEPIAEYLGVSVSTLNKWLRGERNPSDAAARLIDLLAWLDRTHPDVHAQLLPRESP
jgi:DNA-binding transcriptional regulator YiaG